MVNRKRLLRTIQTTIMAIAIIIIIIIIITRIAMIVNDDKSYG